MSTPRHPGADTTPADKVEKPRPIMCMFTERELPAAYQYAEAGGQALHVCGSHLVGSNAPRVFRARVFAHLLDQDLARLKATAKQLGVGRIVVGRVGERGQHVDLCGAPLRKALAEALL